MLGQSFGSEAKESGRCVCTYKGYTPVEISIIVYNTICSKIIIRILRSTRITINRS